MQVLLIALGKSAKPAGNLGSRVPEHDHHLVLEDKGHRPGDAERDHQDLHQSHPVAQDIKRHLRDDVLPL